MKKTRFLLFVLTIVTVLLSACGGAATPTANIGGAKVEPIPVAFLGIVESIAGNQWVINGTTVTVDPAVIRDGPFGVGDQVKVEGVVNTDGSFAVSRVEVPTQTDVSTLPQFGGGSSNDSNTNDSNSNDANANINDDNSNAANTNDDNGNDDNSNDPNSNDDNGNDSNSNDDDSNSNDSNSNDDNSNSAGNDNSGGGSGNNDNGGGDDNGSGGDDDGDNSNG